MARNKKKQSGKKRIIKTLLRRGDKVVVLSGEARNVVSGAGEAVVKRQATIAAIDRVNGKIQIEFEGLPRDRDEQGRDIPIRGIEVFKNHKFNPQADDPGGQRVLARWIDISNIALADPESGKPVGKLRRQKQGKKVARVIVKTGKEV